MGRAMWLSTSWLIATLLLTSQPTVVQAAIVNGEERSVSYVGDWSQSHAIGGYELRIDAEPAPDPREPARGNGYRLNWRAEGSNEPYQIFEHVQPGERVSIPGPPTEGGRGLMIWFDLLPQTGMAIHTRTWFTRTQPPHPQVGNSTNDHPNAPPGRTAEGSEEERWLKWLAVAVVPILVALIGLAAASLKRRS